MATIEKTVCDRCGKEIKYIGWTAKLKNVVKKGKRIKIHKLYNGNPDGYSYCDSSYELCADCTEKLKEFLKGGGVNDEC